MRFGGADRLAGAERFVHADRLAGVDGLAGVENENRALRVAGVAVETVGRLLGVLFCLGYVPCDAADGGRIALFTRLIAREYLLI